MDYYVYIIQSETQGIYYKGYTSNPDLRLIQHNCNKGRFTAGKGLWMIVYLEKMKDKRSALIRERQLKRANINYIKWLLGQECNIIRDQNIQDKEI
jgi:putative endonuclease